jgi:hypothetical protein
MSCHASVLLLLTHERNKIVSVFMLNTLSTHSFESFLKTRPPTMLEVQATVLRAKALSDPSQDDKAGRDEGRRCQNGRRYPASALVVSVDVQN